MLFSILLSACTVQAQFPTTLVLSHAFTPDQVVQLEAGADLWRAKGAHLALRIGDAPGEVTDDVTPVRPAVLIDRMGRTNKDGVLLDVAWIERAYPDRPLEALKRCATHEFGHVLGLGPPTDSRQHIRIWGDIMCDGMDCTMAGDGSLSIEDVEAWVNGGAR